MDEKLLFNLRVNLFEIKSICNASMNMAPCSCFDKNCNANNNIIKNLLKIVMHKHNIISDLFESEINDIYEYVRVIKELEFCLDEHSQLMNFSFLASGLIVDSCNYSLSWCIISGCTGYLKRIKDLFNSDMEKYNVEAGR